VAVLGARQVGKSTLASELARNELAAREFNLDDEAARRAATNDPAGFVAGLRARPSSTRSSELLTSRWP